MKAETVSRAEFVAILNRALDEVIALTNRECMAIEEMDDGDEDFGDTIVRSGPLEGDAYAALAAGFAFASYHLSVPADSYDGGIGASNEGLGLGLDVFQPEEDKVFEEFCRLLDSSWSIREDQRLRKVGPFLPVGNYWGGATAPGAIVAYKSAPRELYEVVSSADYSLELKGVPVVWKNYRTGELKELVYEPETELIVVFGPDL